MGIVTAAVAQGTTAAVVVVAVMRVWRDVSISPWSRGRHIIATVFTPVITNDTGPSLDSDTWDAASKEEQEKGDSGRLTDRYKKPRLQE
ncbi:hypothetical protein E2C01_000550 [Portunus trituberculatus]|uniref:Uncharacterized protein n=1 Tax=Portunus trituberculatus TaxID=210409 RepID=A0A5B7CGV3_PORTR|nr:hypothetical protein [Portunus trituberculatus]